MIFGRDRRTDFLGRDRRTDLLPLVGGRTGAGCLPVEMGSELVCETSLKMTLVPCWRHGKSHFWNTMNRHLSDALDVLALEVEKTLHPELFGLLYQAGGIGFPRFTTAMEIPSPRSKSSPLWHKLHPIRIL